MNGDLIPLGREPLLTALREADALSLRYGLSLTEGQRLALASARDAALRDTGRIEFGPGPLPRLIYALCDSPYVDRRGWADTLGAMQEAFYYFKNESGDAFADNELAEALALAYNGPAGGDVEYVLGLSPEALYRFWREGVSPDDD